MHNTYLAFNMECCINERYSTDLQVSFHEARQAARHNSMTIYQAMDPRS